MRLHGEGTVRTIGTKFQGLIPVGQSYYQQIKGVDKRGRFHGPLVARKHQAIPQAKAEFLRRLNLNPHDANANPSFSTAFSNLLPLLSQELAPTNYASYVRTLAIIKEDPIGSLAWSTITPSDFTYFQTRLKAKAYKPRTIRNHFTRAAAILHRLGSPIKVPRPKVPRTPKRIISPSDQAAIIEWAQTLNPHQALCILIPLLTGLRRSEAVGLTFEDFDPKRESIWLRRSITETDGEVHVRLIGKTEDALTEVALSPILLPYFKQGLTGYVFTGTKEFLYPSSYTNKVRRLFRRDFNTTLTPQDLRRSFGQATHEYLNNPLLGAQLMRHSLNTYESEYVQHDLNLQHSAIHRMTTHHTQNGSKTTDSTTVSNSD